MEKYESKQYLIRRPAEDIYGLFSDLSVLTSVIKDKVEDWHATENSCTFRLKGLNMRLDIADKVPGEYVKICADKGSPVEFTLWIQLKQLAPDDTRMKLTLHAELNMMMKMMIGSKLRQGIDQVGQRIADMFNDAAAGIAKSSGSLDSFDFSGFDFSGKDKLPS